MRTHSLRRLLTVGAAAVAGAVTGLVAAAPAHAVPGLIVAIDWSDLTASEGFKTAEATCPAGTVVLGGGVDVLSGGGQVRVVSMIPFDNGAAADSYYGVAVEDSTGYAANWTMYTWAICGSGVTGWQKVSVTASSIGPVVGTQATCPAGKKVIGTGANIVGNVTKTFLNAVRPLTSALTAVQAEAAREDTASGITVTVTSHAICINPVPGQQVVTTMGLVDSASAKYTRVMCPTGTRLHGTGGALHGANGESTIDRIGLLGAGAVEGADIEAREDETGFAGLWRADAWAICAN
jgi:hypothetical protein